MSVVPELRRQNQSYAETFDQGDLPTPPSKRLAVVACMDARLDVYRLLGLGLGEAHVIRNAGGVVTDDVIRSLVISQRLLGTREIVLIHHTDCGMLNFDGDELKGQIESETGHRPGFSFETFDDLEGNVRESIDRLRECPYLPHRGAVRGFVYQVESGLLREVS